MQKFKKGDIVNFVRSAGFKIYKTPIIAVVPSPKSPDRKSDTGQQVYIIESDNGFVPSITRIIAFELEPKKKYIFVNQDELTLAR